MKPKEPQDKVIIDLLEKDPKSDASLGVTQIESFAKSLLNFEKKLDNFNREEPRSLRVASLDDLKRGHTAKVTLNQDSSVPDENKVIKIKKLEG